MDRRIWGLALAGLTLLPLGSCRRNRPATAPPVPAAPAQAAPATATAPAHEPAAEHESTPRPLVRCFPEAPAWVDAAPERLLDQASESMGDGNYARALGCSEEAVRQLPRSVEAHYDRAIALIHMDRLDEARDALALTLAIAPSDVETLEASADLYINHLPPTAERSTIGLEHVRRARQLCLNAHRGCPRQRLGHLALLEAEALTDLGRAREALHQIDVALAASPHDTNTLYERGVALFELSRFAEARRMFDKVLATEPTHAHAVYHLALIAERDGDEATAARRFAEAAKHDSGSFPPAVQVSSERFADMVKRAVLALPADLRADLAGVPVETANVPALDDLVAEDQPLSPTILGLFRGLPLGSDDQGLDSTQGRSGSPSKPAGSHVDVAAPFVPSEHSRSCRSDDDYPPRAIVLYRNNLSRTVRDETALEQAVTRTLLHEIGHLRGEDDGSLRDRGLE